MNKGQIKHVKISCFLKNTQDFKQTTLYPVNYILGPRMTKSQAHEREIAPSTLNCMFIQFSDLGVEPEIPEEHKREVWQVMNLTLVPVDDTSNSLSFLVTILPVS